MTEAKRMAEDIVAVAAESLAPAVMEQVVVGGDLGRLTSEARMRYYAAVCQSVGLNPLTRPFEYIMLTGKLTLYAKRDATDQLRKLHGVSITDLHEQLMDELYIVTAKARDKDGRTDAAKGAVNLHGLRGEARANALMKAETKAKRRVTLSLCGLGMLDESEASSIPGAVIGDAETQTGDAPFVYETPREEKQIDPVALAESSSPEDDRPFLIQRIMALGKELKLSPKARADLKSKFFGDAGAELEKVDIAQLSALYRELQG